MTTEKAAQDELQNRVCRCCDREFKYPVPKSLATRFYCEECAGLRADSRRMFELFNKRLRRLAKDLAEMKKMVQRPASDGDGKESR